MSELYHYGILGQKWGVRRYQNADGSLTDAGQKRANQILKKSKEQKKSSKIAIHDLKKENREAKMAIARYKTGIGVDEKTAKSAINVLKTHYNENVATIDQIKSGTIKAGKDYITTSKHLKVPIVYIGPTGPKAKLINVSRDKLIMNEKTRLNAWSRSGMRNYYDE